MRTISSALALLLALASPAAAFELKSPDIADGQRMSKAQVYTRCGGDNVSPALEWSGAPAGTKSFVLTMIDQDVSPSQWSHWIVVDLPAGTTALAHNDNLPDGAHGIVSNFGDASYDGPCPPIRTGLHHYRITVWAMPTAMVSLPANVNAQDLAAQLSHQAIGSASLTGTYQR
jgi:Raf kinase inhibitor-like YbhB/YbcL family protein